MNRTGATALGIAGLIVLIAVILVTGGGGASQKDAEGDPVVEGDGAPSDVGPVDIAAASVALEGNAVVFVAEMVQDLDDRDSGQLEFRWDVSEAGADTWIVSASLDGSEDASLISHESAYGSSTIDGTMPGSLSVEGNRLAIRVRAGDVPGFPQSFEWRLTATLDADPRDPASGVARDTAPEGGVGKVEG